MAPTVSQSGLLDLERGGEDHNYVCQVEVYANCRFCARRFDVSMDL